MTVLYTRSFVSLLLAQAAFGYAFASFFLLPKFLAVEVGAGPDGIGLVMASFGVTSVIFIPVVGTLVDRFGRRSFMTAGALLMAATALGFAWVHEVGTIAYGLRALQGLAFAMTFTASATLASDLAPPERLGQALGVFGVSMLSMHALAPAISEEIAARAGWDGVFFTAALAGVGCALLTLRVRESDRRPSGRESSSFWQVARRPRSIRIALVVAASGAAFGAMMTYSQPFALALGREHVRGFFIAYAIAAATVRLGFGSVADEFGRDRVSLASLAAYGAVVTGMAALRGGLLEPIGALFGIAHGLFYPAFNALAVEGAGADERGRVMALYNGSFNAGNATATAALGFLAARAGYRSVFLAAGAGVFVALVLLACSPEGGLRRGREAGSDPSSGKTARLS
ncbi:hypothetical protein MYXO_00237 [Myxococcaceae bacterium]|nr:hypothetical protein MYXO_00237 [Myxococcaceae bacterium]